ncbi:hypothetical protein IT402_00490 [Candidatus Nomurabacteria bacterium]|nr:hypothetical protein [Candidatus Nomurabacteria bacterium]
MKKYNKYGILFLLLAFGISFVAQAEDTDLAPMPPIRVDSGTKIEINGDLKELRDQQEVLRKERLEKEEEMRKQRNEDIMKLRMDARAKIEAGEIKPADAYKMLNAQAKDEREKTREEIEKSRDEFKAALKEGKDDLLDLLREKRDAIIGAIQDKRDLFKIEFEAKKDEMQAKREEWKNSFKEDLKKIKDDTKRERVEKISDNFAEINVKATTEASLTVDKIEAVLIAIESRSDKAAANGQNVSAVASSIVSAETAIADARAAIALQVAKVYETNISSDANAKSALEATRNQFRKDLQAMKLKVKAAYDATKKAADALKKVPSVDAEVEVSVEAETN